MLGQSEYERAIAFMENSRHIEKTGEWWHYPFWREERYIGLQGYSVEEVEEAFSYLKETYSAEWLLEEFRLRANGQIFHPIAPEFLAGGYSIVGYFLNLGRSLVLAKSNDLLSGFRSRLVDRENWYGTWFELELMRVLLENGFKISKPGTGKGNQRCEFLSSKGYEVIPIEAKYLMDAAINKSISILSEDLFHIFQFHYRVDRPKSYVREYLALPPLRAKFSLFENSEKMKIEWQSCVEKIICHLDSIVESQAWGVHEIEDLVKYKIEPIVPDMNFLGRGAGLEPSRDAEIRKIIQNAIEKGSTQFPQEQVGLIVVYTRAAMRYVLQPSDFEWAFQKRPTLGGVLLTHQYFAGRIENEAQYVANPHAERDLSKSELVTLLTRVALSGPSIEL